MCHCVCKYVYASEHVYVCSMCRIHARVCLCACACVRVGARAVLAVLYGRSIASTKVRALPESLGRCKLLEELCVPRPPPPPPFASAAVPVLRCCRGAGAALRVRGGPEPPGAAALVARRDVSNTELAALPAAADWPNLKIL